MSIHFSTKESYCFPSSSVGTIFLCTGILCKNLVYSKPSNIPTTLNLVAGENFYSSDPSHLIPYRIRVEHPPAAAAKRTRLKKLKLTRKNPKHIPRGRESRFQETQKKRFQKNPKLIPVKDEKGHSESYH